ncbi:hypothetical protein AB0892_10580 [Streptomyces sp. NPDC005409]|uniref:hypothetical protein n=1 Tax=Streptomyces sp. NPDC005409 TaxID=3155342 RepID=UPI003457205A
MLRRDLPPPPPPAHVLAQLDEDTVRADRARFLRELDRRSLGIGGLLLLWAVSALFALGWGFVGMGWVAFETHDGLALALAYACATLGAGVLAPAGIWFASLARRDRQVRGLLRAWAGVYKDPAADARLRAPWRSLTWLLASLPLAAAGLGLSYWTASTARPGYDTYGEVGSVMGLGMILWITGLLGVAKAAVHFRWAVRAFPRAQ